MKALVTGFDPFGGEAINPSIEAVRRLKPSLGPLQIVTQELPTVFGKSLDVLADAIARHRPDFVLSVGQAGGRAELSLERVAINLDDARIADNDGQQPIDTAVVPGGPAAYFATLPIKAAVASLRQAGLPAKVSNTAGTFVCNHVFYGLMHMAARPGSGFRAGFMHIPFLPQQAAAQGNAPSMALEHIVQAIEIVLAVSAERREDLAVTEGATH